MQGDTTVAGPGGVQLLQVLGGGGVYAGVQQVMKDENGISSPQ